MILLSKFKLRNMEEKDIDVIYKHIHKDYVNKYFKNERELKELHNREYKSILQSKEYIFHIFENNSEDFIAMVRHRLKDEISEIAIYLNKEFRGKKHSKEILKTSIEKLRVQRKEIKLIKALILEENIISQKLFLSLKFKLREIKTYDTIDYLILVLD